MSWEFDVFVSYSRRDEAFVDSLVEMLRQANLKYWLDREQMPGGTDINDSLIRGLKVSRHVIAVVTENWLARDYTTWEVAAAQEALKGERTLVPLALQSFDAERLGPFLHRRNVLLWLANDPDPDARFWEVYCALRQEGPGRKEEWSAKGRAVRSAQAGTTRPGSVLLPATPAEEEWKATQSARRGEARIIYSCDREKQWHPLEAHARQPGHGALFVTGARGEGHDFFLDAVEECYPETPRRWIRKVAWRQHLPPRDKEEFLRTLGASLPCRAASAADPGEALRAWLRDRNLVLVHRPVLPARLRDEALISYYTRWLPELLPEPGTGSGVLKVIQGIDWASPPQGLGRLTALFRPHESQEVDEALKAIRGQAAKGLPVFLLPQLEPITREQLETFIETLPQEDRRDHEELLDYCLDGAAHSSDILQRIIRRLQVAEERP